MATEENHNSHSFKRVLMEGIPFTKIWEEGKGWYLVMGDYRLTNEHDTETELDAFLESNKWNIITVMMSIVSSLQIEINNKQLKGEE